MSKALATALIVFSPALLWATLVAAASIPSLASQADVVLVGSVEGSQITGSAMAVSLRVQRALKGATVGSMVVGAFPLADPSRPSAAPSVGAYGMWFLIANSDTSGGWTVLPVRNGSPIITDAFVPLPVGSLPVAWEYSDSDPPVDKVVCELRAASASSDDSVVERAHEALRTFKGHTAAARQAQDHIARLGPVHESVCPVARLLREWDSNVTNTVEARLAAGTPGTVPRGITPSVCQITDPATIPALARIIQSGAGDARLQRCVAEAFQNIHTEAALPYLAQLLDSSDPVLQYVGVRGLGHFVQDAKRGAGPGVPNVELFDQNRAAYVALWKQWWANWHRR